MSALVAPRKGLHRKPHFYHLEPPQSCRQHQKGPIHLHLQTYFFHQLPSGDCQLEVPFPKVGRIADVAWLSQKIVFEIQCSAISAEEVIARNRDYQIEGWSVVWILHDQRFNQVRMSAAEMVLRSSPHFFSNMDRSGKGIIYDQFDLCEEGIRHRFLPPLPIALKQGICCLPSDQKAFPLAVLKQRHQQWPYYFSGDLMSRFLHGSDKDYLLQAKAIEKKFSPLRRSKWVQLLLTIWRRGIAGPYQIMFRLFLERLCR